MASKFIPNELLELQLKFGFNTPLRLIPKEILEREIENYEEKRKNWKSSAAIYGNIKRRLERNEPLKGKSLELALEIVDLHGEDELSILAKKISLKITTGQSISEYERHIMLDMLMVHHRLCE